MIIKKELKIKKEGIAVLFTSIIYVTGTNIPFRLINNLNVKVDYQMIRGHVTIARGKRYRKFVLLINFVV